MVVGHPRVPRSRAGPWVRDTPRPTCTPAGAVLHELSTGQRPPTIAARRRYRRRPALGPSAASARASPARDCDRHRRTPGTSLRGRRQPCGPPSPANSRRRSSRSPTPATGWQPHDRDGAGPVPRDHGDARRPPSPRSTSRPTGRTMAATGGSSASWRWWPHGRSVTVRAGIAVADPTPVASDGLESVPGAVRRRRRRRPRPANTSARRRPSPCTSPPTIPPQPHPRPRHRRSRRRRRTDDPHPDDLVPGFPDTDDIDSSSSSSARQGRRRQAGQEARRQDARPPAARTTADRGEKIEKLTRRHRRVGRDGKNSTRSSPVGPSS